MPCADGRILEALEYFRKAWMRGTSYIAGGLGGNIDPHIESSNDRPGNLTDRGGPFMRPIIEFIGWDSFQNIPSEIVLNFETDLVEFQRAVADVFGITSLRDHVALRQSRIVSVTRCRIAVEIF